MSPECWRISCDGTKNYDLYFEVNFGWFQLDSHGCGAAEREANRKDYRQPVRPPKFSVDVPFEEYNHDHCIARYAVH